MTSLANEWQKAAALQNGAYKVDVFYARLSEQYRVEVYKDSENGLTETFAAKDEYFAPGGQFGIDKEDMAEIGRRSAAMIEKLEGPGR